MLEEGCVSYYRHTSERPKNTKGMINRGWIVVSNVPGWGMERGAMTSGVGREVGHTSFPASSLWTGKIT